MRSYYTLYISMCINLDTGTYIHCDLSEVTFREINIISKFLVIRKYYSK